MKQYLLKITALVLAIIFVQLGTANGQIDTLPERLRAAGWSGVLHINHGGEVVLHQAIGLSDRNRNLPLAQDTRFPVASITKMFTSVMILQLYEQGKIDLHAPISNYLPSFNIPSFDHITTHQLLTHTSGLPVTEALKRTDDGVSIVYSKPMSADEIITSYLSAPLSETKGQIFEYNNGDYILLGRIVETISGKSYRDILQQSIIEPLGLTQTGIIESGVDLQEFAKAYNWDDQTKTSTPNPRMHIPNYYASGAMYSTAGDISDFLKALFSGAILSETTLAKLIETHPESRSYGYGAWIRYPQYGRTVPKVLRRYGRIFGYSHLVSHFIDEDLTVVVLSNTDKINPTAIEEVVGEALLGE